MSEQQSDKFEAWGLLELFGHQRLAGRLSEQSVGGVHFIRIDVPAIEGGADAYTRFFTQGAIYGMTPTSEEVARAMAQQLRAVPISRYDLPALAAPAARTRAVEDEDEDELKF